MLSAHPRLGYPKDGTSTIAFGMWVAGPAS